MVVQRKNHPYREGELEVILSLTPTEANIKWLSLLLDRTPDALKLVYRIAFEHGSFGKEAKAQEKKILAAKKRIGIGIGRKNPRKQLKP